MTEAEALARGAARLAESDIPDPQREARILWRALVTGREAEAAPEQAAHFLRLIERRAGREPMSHLLGYRDFYEHRFEISSDVLDPRPETETLVAAALEHPFKRVLDLGTGSGCILLSLLAARSTATGVGTDVSAAALAVAGRNRTHLKLDERAEFFVSNWFKGVSGSFDLIVSNPPYIAASEMTALSAELAYEPRVALTDEADGLTAYRALTEGAGAHLESGGVLMVEIGWTQGEPVSDLFRAAGFDCVDTLPDLDGRDRVIRGIWP